jgi:16S rRNA (cytidine1402-2'-O)-methyltransferase
MVTPLGHLRDVTLRALDVLGAVDAIFAEDTRVTAVLLALRRRNAADGAACPQRGAPPRAIGALGAGRSIALVDAGRQRHDPGARPLRQRAPQGPSCRARPSAVAPRSRSPGSTRALVLPVSCPRRRRRNASCSRPCAVAVRTGVL